MPGRQKQAAKQPSDSDKQRPNAPQESVWEWVVAGIGAVIVAAAIGILLYDATLPKSPPAITVRITSVQPFNSQYLVVFEAKNEGGQGAAEVGIEGELRSGQEIIESRQVTISFLAAGSVATGGLYFSQDPAQAQLELRAVGFQDP